MQLHRKLIASAAFAMAAFASAFAAVSFEVRSNRADQRYFCGEEATFTVAVNAEDGTPLKSGLLRVSLDAYTQQKTAKDISVNLADENPFVVKGKLDKPGFLRLSISEADGGTEIGKYFTSVAYEPEKIVTSVNCPADFNNFWHKAKIDAAKIPLDAKVELDAGRSDEKWNVWRVSFTTVGGRRLHGWLTKEKAATGRLPARFSIAAAGFGGWSQNPVKTPGHITLFMTVFPCEPWSADAPAAYKRLNEECAAKCGVARYPVAGLETGDPKKSFYYPVILGNNRAIEWLLKRDDVDPKRLTYLGTSQGGGLGLAAVALSQRFKKAVFHVPAMTDMVSGENGRFGSWPLPVESFSGEKAKAAAKAALYFDGAFFADQIRIPCFVTCGTSDSACWAPSVWAAYNNLSSKNKVMKTGFGMTHSVWPRLCSAAEEWLGEDNVKAPVDKSHKRISDKSIPVSADPKHWWHRAVKYRRDEAKRLRDADVVWVGDSITHYFDYPDNQLVWKKWFGEPEKKGFFASLFGFDSEKPPYLGYNFGIEGDSTENLINRIDVLKKLCPRVIVLNIGTNNTGKRPLKREPVEDTVAGISKILFLLRCQQPQAKILLYALFPRGKGVSDECTRRNEKVNEAVKEICRRFPQVQFCDIRDAFLNPDGSVNKKYLGDRLHPSREGYELWTDDVLARIRRIDEQWNDKDAISYWHSYGWRGYLELNPEEQRKALKEIRRLGGNFGGHISQRVVPNVKMFDDYDRFPKPESEIRFPSSLADFGIADTQRVDAASFGWNPTNVTKCLQAAIDSGATTVVITPQKGPWYIDSVKLRSDMRLLVKKGAKVLMDKKSPLKDKECLFVLKKCRNVLIEGEGTGLEDSYLGGYENYAERRAWCKNYGKSVFLLVECKDIAFRNLRIAESAEDGILFGGLGIPNVDTYVDNVVLDSHYRQAMSICNGDGLYCRKVEFLNTRGAAPSAGIDFEPPYEIAPNTGVYLYDCVFENNAGGGLMFATSTYAPITVHAKRTKFKRHHAPHLSFAARLGIYLGNNVKPPCKMLFEQCEFENYSDETSIEIMCGPLFDFEIRDSVIRQLKAKSDAMRKYVASPIRFSLNRKFGDDGLDPRLVGVGVFNNVVCEGFPEGTPAVDVADELGLLPIKGALKGSVKMNGKTIVLDDFVYEAPDMKAPAPQLVDLSKLTSVEGAADCDDRMSLEFSGAWWQPLPQYNYVFKARKNDAVSAKLVYPSWLKAVEGKSLELESAKGRKTKIAVLKPGENKIEFTVPEDGWYRIFPPLQRGEGGGVKMIEVKGAHFAYQSDTKTYGLIKFLSPDPSKDYHCYFEVPAGGKECKVRMAWGTLELRDPAGNVVERVRQGEYLGRHMFTIKPSTDKAEIWSFRKPAHTGIAVLKFYRPMTGIIADSIATLPCEYSEHHVPAKKDQKLADISWGDEVEVKVDISKPLVDRSLLSAAEIAKLDGAIAARKALAAKGEWTKRLAEEEALLARMRLTAESDGALRDIEMESLNLPPLYEMASVEKTAKRENENVRELAAFCAVMRNVLEPNGDVVALKGKLFRFGLSLAANADEIIYDDVKKLVLMRDEIVDLLKKR